MGDRRRDNVAELRTTLDAIRADRVRRLRERVKAASAANPDDPLPGILMGVLDLLEDDA